MGKKIRYLQTLGVVAMEGRGFSTPSDMAISSTGRIYVVSRANPLQPYGVRIGICNLDSDYFGDFGGFGLGDGKFVWPAGLAIDRKDNLYLTDEHNHRVTVFTHDGDFQRNWGILGNSPGEFNGPSGICLDSEDNLYVADARNCRIQKFTTDGEFVLEWGVSGHCDGQLSLPWGLACDLTGNVLVADWGNDRIQEFTSEGEFIAKFGESGTGDGQFSRPSGVAIDRDGFIYVADWGNHRLQVLARDGTFLQNQRGQATLSPWAEEFFEANSEEWQARSRSNLTPAMLSEVHTPYEESSRIESYFWGPVSVKLDGEGRLYVTESYRHRIQVYETNESKSTKQMEAKIEG